MENFFKHDPDPFMNVDGLRAIINPFKEFLEHYFPLLKNNPKLKIPAHIEIQGTYDFDAKILSSGGTLKDYLSYNFLPKEDVEKYSSIFDVEPEDHTYDEIHKYKMLDPKVRREGIDMVMDVYNLLMDWQGKPHQTFEEVLDIQRHSFEKKLQAKVRRGASLANRAARNAQPPAVVDPTE